MEHRDDEYIQWHTFHQNKSQYATNFIANYHWMLIKMDNISSQHQIIMKFKEHVYQYVKEQIHFLTISMSKYSYWFTKKLEEMFKNHNKGKTQKLNSRVDSSNHSSTNLLQINPKELNECSIRRKRRKQKFLILLMVPRVLLYKCGVIIIIHPLTRMKIANCGSEPRSWKWIRTLILIVNLQHVLQLIPWFH